MEQVRELEELLQQLDRVIDIVAAQDPSELRSVRDDVYDELNKVRTVYM